MPRLESPDEALAGEARAQRQEAVLLEWFRAGDLLAAGLRWTPSEIHNRPAFRTWPLTSVRRALTNLTARGYLVHHKADRRQGPRGARESTWSLA